MDKKGYEIKVFDSIEVEEYFFPYDAEYGTGITINMGKRMLLIQVPPDYKGEVIRIQVTEKKRGGIKNEVLRLQQV